MRLKWKNILLIMLPLFPLFDMIVVKQFALSTFCVYIISFFVFAKRIITKKMLTTVALVVTYIASIISATINNGFKMEYLMFALTLLTFTVIAFEVGNNVDIYIDALVRFVLFYFTLNTFIFIWRMAQYGLDLSRLRSGMSIYGGIQHILRFY